jgi:hypothetical protein
LVVSLDETWILALDGFWKRETWITEQGLAYDWRGDFEFSTFDSITGWRCETGETWISGNACVK